MIQRLEVDEAPPAPPLRVFISYKEKDFAATKDIKRLLSRIGGDRVRVFVSGDEPAGYQWRERVLKELCEAHILIFLYTDPERRWDWCLYETGYFDARLKPVEINRRLYVLHGHRDPPSGPFLGLKTVPIDTSDRPDDTALKAFLQILFEQSTSPAVNPHWDEGGCQDLVTAFTVPFRGRESVGPPEEYIRRLTFRLAKGAATEDALRRGHIPANTLITGSPSSFALFGLRGAGTPTWETLEKAWHERIPPPPDGSTSPDPATLWIENVAQKMWAAIRGNDFDDGLPLFFSHFADTPAQALFRPSLARLVLYPDTYEFDIVFVDVPPELAAPSDGPLTTVGSLLRLAHMFRLGWIEPVARDVVQRPPTEIAAVARDMERRLNSITAESFVQGIRTEQAVLVAFEEGSALQNEVKQSMDAWQQIAPALANALRDKDSKGILDALKQASAVNWQFHRACAQRYLDIVDKHSREATGPLHSV